MLEDLEMLFLLEVKKEKSESESKQSQEQTGSIDQNRDSLYRWMFRNGGGDGRPS